MRAESEDRLPEARENAGDQVAIGFSLESDWLMLGNQSNPGVFSTLDGKLLSACEELVQICNPTFFALILPGYKMD